jgi:hypothetical protein
MRAALAREPIASVAANRLRARFTIEPSFAAAERLLIESARSSVNAFAEYCFTDNESGAALVQARHHRELHEIADRQDRCIFWYPVEHGKTTQAKIKLIHLLGQHPSRQYAYLSSKSTQARKTVLGVAREIMVNERIARVFPNLRPQQSTSSRAMDTWGSTALRVEGCPPSARDPSLAAYGLDGEILGARLHGIVIDNILDRDNTSSPVMRAKVLDVLENEVFTRILPGGFVLILDTSWHAEDALHVLSRRAAWHSAKFDAEDGGEPQDGGERPTLWPARWPRKRLEAKRAELGTIAYNRQFRNIPLSKSLGVFNETALSESVGKTKWLNSRPYPGNGNGDEDTWAQEIVCTGVDLATRKGEEHDETVLWTMSKRINDGSCFRTHHVMSCRAEAGGIVRAILDIHRRFHKGAGLATFRVEDNGAQVYIQQMIREAAVLRGLGATEDDVSEIVVVGHTTTRRKRHEELGIPGLATDVEMGRMWLPEHSEIDKFIEECKSWSPDAHTGDRLMAAWIAREGLRQSIPTAMVLG